MIYLKIPSQNFNSGKTFNSNPFQESLFLKSFLKHFSLSGFYSLCTTNKFIQLINEPAQTAAPF
jgi:hypothetical protein